MERDKRREELNLPVKLDGLPGRGSCPCPAPCAAGAGRPPGPGGCPRSPPPCSPSRGAAELRAVGRDGGSLPRLRWRRVLLAEGQRGAAAAVAGGPRRCPEPRAEPARPGEGVSSGRVGGELPGGPQAELHGRAARFARPPAPLRGPETRVQPHIERALPLPLLLLVLLPHEERRALLPAARRAPPAGLQHVGDPPQPALLGGRQPGGQKRAGSQEEEEEEAPSDPTHVHGGSPAQFAEPGVSSPTCDLPGRGSSSARRPRPAPGRGEKGKTPPDPPARPPNC